MKLRELFESAPQDAAIIFGRFNPPHFGHKAAWEIASEFPIWYVGTNKSTQGPKDPLPFNIKIEAMKTFMPELKEHLVAEQSWFTLASMVYKKHGAVTLHIVTDDKDVHIYLPMLQKQNGVKGPHGFYHFKNIVWTEAQRQSEASKVRKAVAENNPEDFEKYSGVPANTAVAGKPYFELVKHFMMPYMQAEDEKARAKAEKERIKAEKEAAKADKANKADTQDAETVEDAAGVGIITKQNSTGDVNASTPGRNLRAFNLVKEANRAIRELRNSVVSENKPNVKMPKALAHAGHGGETIMRDIGGYDRVYHLNRIMMATAMADGKSKKPVDMDPSSWVEKYNVAFPYTDEEQMMMFQAMATIPTDGKELQKRSKSQEAPDTNTTSAVAKPKRNKYGI